MRNIITINSILNAYTCLSSTSEDENSIYFKCIVGEVISPKLKILLDGVQVASVSLNVNQSNLVNVTEYIPVIAGVLSVHYSDYDNEGTTYSIEFDSDKTGDLKLCEVDETSFNAKYYTCTPSTGGTVSVEVNSTTTGEAGSEAQVTNSGDDVNVKLNFVIPKGADGKDGADGVSPTVVNSLTSTSTTNALSAYQGKVLNDKITNTLSNIAVTNVTGSSISVESGSVTSLCSITLSAGLYILQGNASFGANTTGWRAIRISTTANSYANERGSTVNQPATTSSSNATMLQVNLFVSPSTTTTYYLNGYQNSGSTLSVSGQFRALKLKG